MNPKFLKFLIFSLLAMVWVSPLRAEEGPILRTTIAPQPGDNFTEASFALLLPDEVKEPDFILVLLPHFNGKGEQLLQKEQWLSFAKANHGAMLACTFRSDDAPIASTHYAAAQYGSGAALDAALIELESLSGLALTRLPLLMFGHSGGGQFAYGYSCHKPERMIGFGATKGGCYFPEPSEASYRVPGIIISGHQDLLRRRNAIRELFESHRRAGAYWCWAEDEAAHGSAKTLDLIIPYFQGLLDARPGHSDDEPLQPGSGLWVNLTDQSIVENSADNTDKPTLGWLPSTAAYEAWKQIDIGAGKYDSESDSSL